uniref:Ig-like domain-containing protein n=1 Tax=Cyprinus carpio TaxID=7962 RepID=A0A8C2BZD8_CYPCA
MIKRCINYIIIIGCTCICVFCVYSISLPQRVEALQGSCVFIPCTFDIDQQLNIYLTNNAKRKWLTSSTLVFDSSSPNTGLLKGEIFGTATQKNCTTRFDNVSQSHNGSYYFRLESSSVLQYSYLYSQVQIAVLGECHIQELMKMMEVIEGSSVNLRCSTKIFCPSRPPSLRWSSSLNENVTEKQYQNQSEFISDLNLTVSLLHHRVTFTCTATHQLQQPITTQESWMLLVQYAPKNTSLSAFPSSSVMEGKPVTLNCSTDANPAELNYTWYRETGSQFELLQTGYNQTYIVTNPTHGAWYGCNAQNQYGQCNTTIQLDVQCEYKDRTQINLI